LQSSLGHPNVCLIYVLIGISVTAIAIMQKRLAKLLGVERGKQKRQSVCTLRQMSPPAAGGRDMCHSNSKRRQGECKMNLDMRLHPLFAQR